jgi:Methyltransferase domain
MAGFRRCAGARTCWSAKTVRRKLSADVGSLFDTKQAAVVAQTFARVASRTTVWRVVDPIFAEPRLAEVYDPLDPDRSDLDAYLAMVDEFGARSVLDIGCGTGTLACLLARRGLTVTAVDPAEASLAVARTKPGAEWVRWVRGDATDLPPLQVELVTMTANVAQVFLTDAEWDSTCGLPTRRFARVGVWSSRPVIRQRGRGWSGIASGPISARSCLASALSRPGTSCSRFAVIWSRSARLWSSSPTVRC